MVIKRKTVFISTYIKLSAVMFYPISIQVRREEGVSGKYESRLPRRTYLTGSKLKSEDPVSKWNCCQESKGRHCQRS